MIDRALVAKYNRPGPRYTSYPTAVQFTEAVPQGELLDAVRAESGPLSLYTHLPFCETLCWYCGCHTVITKDKSRADAYLDFVAKEIAHFAPLVADGRRVAELHWGGGTPNFLEPRQITRLHNLLHDAFPFDPETEQSVELDPRTLREEQVATFAAHGFQRASFGVQDIDPAVQLAIHRHQPHPLNVQTMAWLRAAGFTSINIDLVYGLPHQTPESFAETLDAIIALKPDRLAVFSYAHVPWLKPAQKKVEKAGLPSAEEKLDLLLLIIERLTAAGYVHIGMDHFARPDDDLAVALRENRLHRNFQGYVTRGGLEIAAFGISAISQTDGSYRQNEKTLDGYAAALEAGRLPLTRGYLLTRDDHLRRDVIHTLMCRFALDKQAVADRWEIDFARYFAASRPALDELLADGLIREDDRWIEVLPPGRLLVRNVAMAFDAHFLAQAGRHAQTV